jgi:predicted small lipoprotein YifL
LNPSFSIRLGRAATLCVLAGTFLCALTLAGCGRKGGLDPPPVTSAVPVQPAPEPEGSPAGQLPPPVQPTRKSTWLDWLVN